MRMFGLKELAGEKFWQRLPVLSECSAQLSSARHAHSGLPVTCLLPRKSKGNSTGIDLHFSWSGLKTFLSCVFPPWPTFLWWYIFLVFLFFCFFFPKDGKEHKLCLGCVFPPSFPSSLRGKSVATLGAKSLLDHQPPISLTGLGGALATSKAERKVKYMLKYLLPKSVSVWDMTSFPSGIYGLFIRVIKKAAQWQAEVTCGLVLAWNFHKE